ncbi:hypothetical protein [Oceanisphaera sp.]|uniref:hypothetical protein n=1 Tax=Oceanisphaera sp. TaxID=1929979 RepID=UPI003A8D475D
MKRLLLLVPLFWLMNARGQDSQFPTPDYPPLEQFEEISQRPLFNDNRRPRVTENNDDIGANAAALQKKWRLTGVVWEGEQQLALFGERQGEGRMRLKTGMYLSGDWQLEAIELDGVRLGDGIQSFRLTLWEPRQPPTRSVSSKAQLLDNNTGYLHEATTAPDTKAAEAATSDDNNKQGSNGESQ